MKALFLKEWRQNYLLFLFSLIMTGFIPAMYALLYETWVRDWKDVRSLCETMGVAYVAVSFIIVLFSSAGLIAGETERGTLPVLLGLPLSRARVWLAKLGAGLSMAVVGLAMLLGSQQIALPQTEAALNWGTLWRDLPILWTLGFSLGFFWSAVLNRTISALLATIVFGPAMFVMAALFMGLFGASLLGYDAVLDVWLWMLSTIPGMLLASYMTFSRSGMETSRRKWRRGVAWLAAGVFVTGLVIVGVVRWQTRYQRAGVAEMVVRDIPAGGSAICVVAAGRPVWSSAPGGASKEGLLQYSSQHTVVVDLKTGRELLVRRGRAWVAAVSRDGKVAALAIGLPTLTWRSTDNDTSEVRGVEIWDLERRRLLYRGLPEEFWEKGRPDIQAMEWSPDGEWLLMGADVWGSAFHQEAMLHASSVAWFRTDSRPLLLMRRDGTHERVVPAWGGISGQSFTYAWDPRPGAHAIYAFARDGRLDRYDLDTGKSQAVWQGPSAGDQASVFEIAEGQLVVSPDGRMLAVGIIGPALASGEEKRNGVFVFVLPAEGAGAGRPAASPPARPARGQGLVWAWDGAPNRAPSGLRLSWSADGHSLCAAAIGESNEGGPGTLRVMRWKEGSERPLVGEAAAHQDVSVRGLVSVPGSDQFLVWYGGTTRLVDKEAALRPLPEPMLAMFPGVVGFDSQGRAIIVVSGDRSKIAALDVQTGKVTDIYP